MKLVFVGPSLPDAVEYLDGDITLKPPACQGDVIKAVTEGVKVIGLIDGQFEYVAPVWHKELLFALSQGVTVLGASSMGALRAAECAEFGMIGVGRIFEDYQSGKRIDDGDVALQYGPEELHYIPTSVPMVNVDSTLENAVSQNLISETMAVVLSEAGRKIYFKHRSWQRIFEAANLSWIDHQKAIKQSWVDQKRHDALALLDRMKNLSQHPHTSCDWTFNPTPLWRSMYGN